jgi:hypothetical protein
MLGIKCFLFKEKRKNVSRKKVGFGLIKWAAQGGKWEKLFSINSCLERGVSVFFVFYENDYWYRVAPDLLKKR